MLAGWCLMLQCLNRIVAYVVCSSSPPRSDDVASVAYIHTLRPVQAIVTAMLFSASFILREAARRPESRALAEARTQTG